MLPFIPATPRRSIHLWNTGMGIRIGRRKDPMAWIGRLAVAALLGLTAPGAMLAAELYWYDAQFGTISAAGLDGSNQRVVVPATNFVGGIAVDGLNGWVYWSETNSLGDQGVIKRAHLDGSSTETIVNSKNRPIGLAVEPTSGKLFWTSTTKNQLNELVGLIESSNLDGTGVQTVHQGGLAQPFGITIDASTSSVYVTDVNNKAIYRSGFDGSGFAPLVTTGLVNPRGISLDPVSQSLFWTDNLAFRIETAQANGTGRSTLLPYSTPDGIVYSPGDSAIYWTDFASPGKILRANADGTLLTTAIGDLGNPRYLALAVPEPSTAVLLIVAGVICCGGRLVRRRTQWQDRS